MSENGSGAIDALLAAAKELYAANDFSRSFAVALQVLRADYGNITAQALALRMLVGLRGEGFEFHVEKWVEACGFGNIENAAIIVSGIAGNVDETYMLCSHLSSIIFRLGQSETALRVFGHCLTDVLPPVSAPDAEAVYQDLADSYDSDPMHRASVADFVGFVQRHLGAKGPYDIIDAPCGTGLAGPALAPLARRMVGCDLSPAMLSKAEQRGCYQTLIAGDLFETLPQLTGDLLICHGSLYHFGDLAPVAAAAAAALAPGGWFAFSDIPAPRGVMATIRGNLRLCHSSDHVRDALLAHGFQFVTSELAMPYGLPCVYWLFQLSAKR